MPERNGLIARTIEGLGTNDGKVGGYFEGATILLLHTRAPKRPASDEPLVYLPDGDRYVVIASKGVPHRSRIGTTSSSRPRTR